MARDPLSIFQQAALVESLADRCVMRNGSVAAETHITLTVETVDDLKHLAHRLRLIAPHESKIKNLVMGR